MVEFVPKLCNATNSKTLELEKKLSQVLVGCLTASKSETRSSAEIVIKKYVENNILSKTSINRAVKKLTPAHQRAVGVLIEGTTDNTGNGVESANNLKETPRMMRRSSSAKLPRHPTPSSARSIMKPEKKLLNIETKSCKVLSPQDNVSSTPFLSSADNSSCDSNHHPICLPNATSIEKESRINKRNWPEYPEEPSDRELQSLKKIWCPMLPSSSISHLFPSKGFINQEDSLNGAKILTSALAIAEEDQTNMIFLNQLDLIFKWLVCAMCAREHTTGYIAILDLLTKIFSLLRVRNYQLTDLEAG